MTSPARVAANRRNALGSTGPRTVEGKAASSRNAVKHGLLSCQPLLSDEDPAEYHRLNERLVEAHSPEGAVEELLVDELLGVLWRLRRLRRVEVALYAIGAPASVREALRLSGEEDAAIGVAWSSQADAFATLSRYEGALVSRLRRTLNDLERRQANRIASETDLVVIDGEG